MEEWMEQLADVPAAVPYVQVKELLEQLADVQCSFEKCSREKMSVTAELEVARGQINSVDVDYSKVIITVITSGQSNLTRGCIVPVHELFMHLQLENILFKWFCNGLGHVLTACCMRVGAWPRLPPQHEYEWCDSLAINLLGLHRNDVML